MGYVRKRWKQVLPCVVVFAAFNIYFFFFIQNGRWGYLIYLDILLFVPGLLLAAYDYHEFRKNQEEKRGLMGQKELICRMLPWFENQDIAEHDVQVLEEQADRQFKENCDLQDYVAKWCHELKIPLSAALLMDEKIGDRELKLAVREQLEKMNQQIHSMLLGCRLQSPLFDLQVKRTELSECVRQSVRNNRFFLIQRGFELTVEVGQITVYTDPSWLVYILDQLMNNAIKYGERKSEEENRINGRDEAGELKETDSRVHPKLRIWAQRQEDQVRLFVEDYGEGIKDSDIGRIFEKGFTGSNYHNGKYKSTGMGLYMVSRIIDRLGHGIQVESQQGAYTRFCIIFKENPYFLR